MLDSLMEREARRPVSIDLYNGAIDKIVKLETKLKAKNKEITKLKNQPKLDEKEVREIIKDVLVIVMSNFCDENIGDPIDMAMDIWEKNEKDFNLLITKICKLQPKNQKVIAEGMVMHDLGKIGNISYINLERKIAEIFSKNDGKNMKLLLEVEDDK